MNAFRGPPVMTSNRPYLLRALYEWINDNAMTPYILVDAGHPGVQVPQQAIKDGRVVLNIAARAVSQISLGDAEIGFLARFGGVSQHVRVPVGAVLAIYAQESGQGMTMPEEVAAAAAAPAPAEGQETATEDPPKNDPPGGGKKGPRLRVVK